MKRTLSFAAMLIAFICFTSCTDSEESLKELEANQHFLEEQNKQQYITKQIQIDPSNDGSIDDGEEDPRLY